MIIDFLKTKRSKAELQTALEILREFKECESDEEWLMVPFVVWSKLEQLEEFLAHLAEGAELADDTKGVLEGKHTVNILLRANSIEGIVVAEPEDYPDCEQIPFDEFYRSLKDCGKEDMFTSVPYAGPEWQTLSKEYGIYEITYRLEPKEDQNGK